ncbi:glutamyl aminopeptidase-like [Anopheles aquasalis]|uniref:glutamyl aminopeptidase-like n=1 Tax=Anopheles aquasalis TaxID=42839 RepID=UPI00215A840E|nr:glutamyl aminopeptidase-like [Anopheles aquasalis]
MWLTVVYLCAGLWFPVWTAAAAGDPERLPNGTVPLHYDLWLETSSLARNDFNYQGKVAIRLAVVSDTPIDGVVLHNVGNRIEKTELKSISDGNVIAHELSQSSELLKLRTNRLLNRLSGDAELLLTITFSGSLGKEKKGFYRTQYRGPKRVPVTVATTHFQPCYARYAFPCFDEPALKAPFSLTIVSNRNHLVASNTAIAKVTNLPGDRKTVQFEQTAPLQTYLVAFLVSTYDAIHTRSPSGVQVGVLAPPKDQKALQFSLQAASALLTRLERYTGQSLGLTKLEHVAIPRFGNAMENWGLVAYDEQFLVLAGRKVHRQQRVQAVITIGHETAHQLFGNLVGPAWWSYLWLSEGFATYFEMILGSAEYPDLIPLEESFAMRHMRPALQADAVPGAHALTVEPLPANTAQIEELFDSLTYSKAGCVLRMINCTIGETAFRAGVRRYLETHRNGVVEPKDLYASFSQGNESLSAGWPSIEEMFRSWTDKPGYPVVTVERLNISYVRFRQQRYQLQAEQPADDTPSRWLIPITYFTNSSRGKYEYRPALWMRETDRELVVRLEMKRTDVLIVNPRQIGFYRVEYTQQRDWQKMVPRIRSLPAVTQAKLIDDAFVLARIGRTGYDVCLTLLDQLSSMSSALPWLTAMSEENVGFLQRSLRSFRFDRVVQGLAGEMFQFFSNTSSSSGNRRSTAIEAQALDRAYDWWKRLGGTTRSGRRLYGPRFDTGCPPAQMPALTADELTVGLASQDEAEELRLFGRLKCQKQSQDTALVTALERIAKNGGQTDTSDLYRLLLKLLDLDPGRFLSPVLHILTDFDRLPRGEPIAVAAFLRLLNRILLEVTDHKQVAVVQQLIGQHESLLPHSFLEHASTIMTSTLSWRMANVAKLNRFLRLHGDGQLRPIQRSIEPIV